VNIGNWVRRENARPRGKWHLVDSTVAGAAFTRCGKRMEPQTSHGGLEVSEVEPLTRMIEQTQLCHGGCA